MFGNNPTLRFPGNLMQVRSITELRGISPYEMNDEAAILVTAAGLFTFDASSLANDDGVSAIRPNGFTPLQSGRWVSSGSSSAGVPGPAGPAGPAGPPGSSSATSRVDFAAERQNTETDQECYDRLIAAGNRRFYFKGGGGLTGGKYTIGCEPWTNGDIQRPDSPNYNPAATVNDLIEFRGNILPGLDIEGDGMGKTVFLQKDSNYGFMGNALGGPEIEGVRFEGVTFEGNNVTYTIASQSFHNVALFGVRDAKFVRCEFKASPGDGIYLSRGPKQGDTNHNYNCYIDNCFFNGVNNINRNPLSLEDCTGLTFTNNLIEDFTKSGEPGWDIEPVITSSTLGNNLFQAGQVVMTGNTFRRCNGVTFCLQMDPRLSITYGGMFIVAFNLVEDCFSFIDVVGPPDDQNDVSRGFGCLVTGNVVRRLTGPIGRLGGALDVTMHSNSFEDADLLRFGYGWGNRFTNVNRNKFIRCGRTNGFVFIANLDTRYINLDDNEYISCGRTDGLGTNAILLTQDGANEYLTPVGAVVPRIMGISIRGGHVVNTKSDGGAGVLTHFAIHNATGAYGPGAAKGGTKFDGTAIANADTYNPPAPRMGKYLEVAIPNGTSINGGGQTTLYDQGLAGLDSSTRLRAYYSALPANGFAPLIHVTPITASTVRVVVYNIGASWTVPNGTKLIIEEY